MKERGRILGILFYMSCAKFFGTMTPDDLKGPLNLKELERKRIRSHS
jgi:hypothetical protein